MPLEDKLRSVPYLKALTSGLEYLSGHGHDSIFTHHYTLLKTWRFIVKIAVLNKKGICTFSIDLVHKVKVFTIPLEEKFNILHLI